MAVKTTREKQAELMARKRAGERDIQLPKCKNPERRAACEKDIPLALRTYFPEIFYNPFSPDQLEMIAAIERCARYGGRKAIAGPRGYFGKTTITTCTVLLLVLMGVVRFPLIVQATGPAAKRTLRNMKTQLRFNELLAEDFPEVCVLARYVGSAPARANGVTVNGGQEVNMLWRDDFILLPTIAGSKSSGAVLCTTGITGEIRGLNVESRRPDMVIIDDVDTRESATSEIQTKQIELTIEQDIAGLAGPGKTMATIMLCTCINRQCIAYQYTDPKIKPAWHGVRYKMLVNLPRNTEWWDKYLSDRIAGMSTGEDPDGRRPHARYVAERALADDGAIISNPYAFIGEQLPDGSQVEESALQHCYNRIADAFKEGEDGWQHFLTEYQNDPPDENEQEGTQITQRVVAKRISGLGQCELPAGDFKLVAMMDVGNNVCYFTESAWTNGAIGHITDYGTFDVQQSRDQQTLDLALLRVFHDWRTKLLAKYQIDGQTRIPDIVLIDSGDGHHTNAVYQFCREAGPPFFPSKGMKDGWRAPKHAINRGDHWALVPQDDRFRTRLVEFESTYWKQYTHQRFLTPSFDDNQRRRDGSLAIFVCPEHIEFVKRRREYTHQIVGEVWGIKKQGARPGWITTGKNHFLDTTAGNCLGANILGNTVLKQVTITRERSRLTIAPKIISRPGGWIPQRGHS